MPPRFSPIAWWLTVRAAGGSTAPFTGHHPLCVALEGRSAPQKAQKYVCRGDNGDDDGDLTCSPTGIDAEMVSNLSAGEGPEEVLHSSVWWVCKGYLTAGTEGAGALHDKTWVQCEGYFAFDGDLDDPVRYCREPSGHDMIGTNAGRSNAKPTAGHATQHVFATAASDPRPYTHRYLRMAGDQDPGSDPVAGEVTVERRRTVDAFVRTTGNEVCSEVWASWPAIQEFAVAKGTVIVFHAFPSVGNLFIVLLHLMKVARLLQLGLVLDWHQFPGFRAAFEPSKINWDLDVAEVVRRAHEISQGVNPAGVHALRFRDGVIILSDAQLWLLASKMGISGSSAGETAAAVGLAVQSMRELLTLVGQNYPPTEPCAWNLLLKRSASMMARLSTHSPWDKAAARSRFGSPPSKYVGWHIRTSDGETKYSFDPNKHPYVFNGETSSTVFPLYLTATGKAEDNCPGAFPAGIHGMPIYISSNSKSMVRNCSVGAAEHSLLTGSVDLGVSESDAHTEFSKDPETAALNAFIDFLFLMDASILVRTGSSFSGMIVAIKGLKCHGALPGVDLPVRDLFVCLPTAC